MKRDRLQKLCKKLKLKANGKNADMVASLQQYFESCYVTTARATEKDSSPETCSDWPSSIARTEDSEGVQSHTKRNRSPIEDNAKTNTTNDKQMPSERETAMCTEISQLPMTKDCPKATTTPAKQTKPSSSQPMHSPCHHSQSRKDLPIKMKRKRDCVSKSQSEEEIKKKPKVLPQTSHHPPSKSPQSSQDIGSRRRTYSISPNTKTKSHDELTATIMEELEQRLQQKYGSKLAVADDRSQSRIPRLAVFCIGKSPHQKQTKFDGIHKKTFARMESISDYMDRKAQHAKKLLTPIPTRSKACHTKSPEKINSTVKKPSTFSFSMQSRKTTNNPSSTACNTPFKFSAPKKETPKKPQFDLQSSLSRQLSYKPHTGKLKDSYWEDRDKTVAPVKRHGLKTRQAPPIRSKCRSEVQKLQKAKRNENVFNRRQLN